jgi:flagellar hook protein FlgE
MSSVLPIALSGMNAASQQLQSAATRIATSSGGDLEDAIVQLMVSRIGFEANAKVAQSAAQALNTLLDIKI